MPQKHRQQAMPKTRASSQSNESGKADAEGAFRKLKSVSKENQPSSGAPGAEGNNTRRDFARSQTPRRKSTR